MALSVFVAGLSQCSYRWKTKANTLFAASLSLAGILPRTSSIFAIVCLFAVVTIIAVFSTVLLKP